jgi:transposase InsO family protein
VEGFSDLTSQLEVGADSVVLAVCMRGAPFFVWFQEFKALVENQSGKGIKVLRSDNGGEYSSRQFVDFCAQHGITRQMIVPYNPQ